MAKRHAVAQALIAVGELDIAHEWNSRNLKLYFPGSVGFQNASDAFSEIRELRKKISSQNLGECKEVDLQTLSKCIKSKLEQAQNKLSVVSIDTRRDAREIT